MKVRHLEKERPFATWHFTNITKKAGNLVITNKTYIGGKEAEISVYIVTPKFFVELQKP